MDFESAALVTTSGTSTNFMALHLPLDPHGPPPMVGPSEAMLGPPRMAQMRRQAMECRVWEKCQPGLRFNFC